VSISSASSSGTSTIQELARTILDRFDANRDQQLSFAEFASFLDGFVQSVTGSTGTATGARTASASATNLFLTTDGETTPAAETGGRTYHDRMLGFNFDLFETGRGSTKYDAARILQHYDPADPDAMKKVHAEMERLYPGATSLDIHNDLMLDGTADGYIGRRPLDREEDWSNPPSGWVWQWMAYNHDHIGPDGEGRA
jgi:hypothetical protein